MNVEIVKRMIKNKNITDKDYVTFILDYIKFKNKPEPTSEQLEKILLMLNLGYFNVKEPLMELIQYFKLNVVYTYNPSGFLIRTDIYE